MQTEKVCFHNSSTVSNVAIGDLIFQNAEFLVMFETKHNSLPSVDTVVTFLENSVYLYRNWVKILLFICKMVLVLGLYNDELVFHLM